MLVFQDKLPLNPDGNPGQSPDLAYNSIISFVTNTNLQHYSGESGATYLTQLFVFNFLQFVSAATGIACLIALFNGLKEKTTNNLGNFWSIFIKSTTRLLLPLSIIVAIILAFNGTPTSFAGKDTITTLQGDTVQVSRGPAAAMIAIKQMGTNGGGYFGANSAVPFENPNYLTNIVEVISIPLISIALIFALGYYIKRKKFAYMIMGVMTVLFVSFCINNIYFETKGNPEIDRIGIAQNIGAMEGKEIRLGSAATAYWSVITTSTSNGSVNGMHDSLMPLSGGIVLIDMMINALYGGVGVGLLNFYIFIIIAVFISGLMVGRTPELMGHKVEHGK
jgi:K+-transporting ATPase ATPase A chain